MSLNIYLQGGPAAREFLKENASISGLKKALFNSMIK